MTVTPPTLVYISFSLELQLLVRHCCRLGTNKNTVLHLLVQKIRQLACCTWLNLCKPCGFFLALFCCWDYRSWCLVWCSVVAPVTSSVHTDAVFCCSHGENTGHVCSWHRAVVVVVDDDDDDDDDDDTSVRACFAEGWPYLMLGVHRFSKNVGVGLKFYAPEGWLDAPSI